MKVGTYLAVAALTIGIMGLCLVLKVMCRTHWIAHGAFLGGNPY